MCERRCTIGRFNGARNETLQIADAPGGHALLDDVQCTGNTLQKIIEVVRDPAGELPDGFHLLTLAQRLFRFHQLSCAFLHALLEVLPADWMRTALAKGLSYRRALRSHALRNALLTTITLAGLSLPSLVAGSLFIEKVFAWPGMGLITANAISSRDYPLLTASVLITSVAVALGTLFADVAAAAADPRIRVT